MALLPPMLLLLFTVWAGTFYGGASAAGAFAGQLALLALVVWGGLAGAVRMDVLRLGRAGRWLPVALVVAAAASLWASPVPRAGRVGVILLPAFLLLPAVVERCWTGGERRRLGLRGHAAVVGVVAGWALVDHLVLGSPRASAPLGHHNLLAVWLLASLPPALLPLRQPGPWRWVGASAAILGTAALLATRSLLGLLALAGLILTVAIAALRRLPRGRRASIGSLLAGAVVIAVLAGVVAEVVPRLVTMASGRDVSAQARKVYAEAGWEGWKQRPWLGWGPGSTPWTVSWLLHPRPGVNPPSEVVGQLHGLHLQLAYELGVTGWLLGLGLAAGFGRSRWRERRPASGARDPALLGAALAGLGASGVALLGTSDLAVTALPVALAVTIGATLSGGPGGTARAASRGAAAWGTVAYAAVALVLLLPLTRAQFHYEKALRLEGAAAVRELAAAVSLDPRFPLYRARATWLGGTGALGRQAAAEPALTAARDAVGVGPLWLMAGVYGLEARAAWSPDALERACRLDPLAPLAPFYRLAVDPSAPEAAARGARALLAEPRLLAATFWGDRPELLAATLVEVERWPGVENGWKVELLATAGRLAKSPASGIRERQQLLWGLDESGVDSFSLHLFRRRPAAVRLAPVSVRGDFAGEISLPPASTLPGTSPRAFSGPSCGLPAASGLSTNAVENFAEKAWIWLPDGATTGLCAL